CCLPDDDERLARYAKLTRDKWRKIRPTLEQFFRIRDGHWHQARLQDEFRLLQSRRKQQAEAGRASARSKSLKRHNRDQTIVDQTLQRNGNETATPTPTPTTDNKLSDANASPDDTVKEIFDQGVALLTGAGMASGKARSLIGKWRKDQGDAATLAAIVAARDHSASSPVEWITARFRKIGEDVDEEQAIRRATLRRYRDADMGTPPDWVFGKAGGTA
ncbi:MAG: DUF1376 domain-containing protein, partial [Pigmentiphaga sp.]